MPPFPTNSIVSRRLTWCAMTLNVCCAVESGAVREIDLHFLHMRVRSKGLSCIEIVGFLFVGRQYRNISRRTSPGCYPQGVEEKVIDVKEPSYLSFVVMRILSSTIKSHEMAVSSTLQKCLQTTFRDGLTLKRLDLDTTLPAAYTFVVIRSKLGTEVPLKGRRATR
ncbi:hypothetical protein BJ165DRAFT_1590568 [Panaeolus papilionaceus]|nr:hypothetical protein BJ165DRAFT_1590568 [Panaeolus papilionaceus]